MEKQEWERLVENLIKEGILRTSKIIKVMRSLPRTQFLPEDMKSYSAADTPLPVGLGQTISAPHSLALTLG